MSDTHTERHAPTSFFRDIECLVGDVDTFPMIAGVNPPDMSRYAIDTTLLQHTTGYMQSETC